MNKEKEFGYSLRQLSKERLFDLLKNLSDGELHCALKKLYLLKQIVTLNVPIPILMNLYCVMYSEVTNNVWVDGFVVTNNVLVDKEQGDSLRDRAHLLKKREEIKPDKKVINILEY